MPAIGPRDWYVFVRRGAFPGQPETWVVPRDHVVAATWIGHMSWLTDPAALPGTRNTGIEIARTGAEVWNQYRGRWDLLDAPAADAPVLLPLSMRERIDWHGVGLPPDHPWHAASPEFIPPG